MAGDDVIVLHNGSPYVGWKTVEISQDFDQAVGTCKLTISRQPGRPLPMKLGDDVTVLLGTSKRPVPVITGYVKGIEGGHEWGSHDINLDIMDQTRFVVDSTVGPGVKFKTPVSLKKIATDTLGKMGLSKIKVIDNVGVPDFGPGEVPVAAIDERGQQFLDKWANKRQVLFNTDGKGNLVIDRNQQKTGPGMLYKGPEDSSRNNILSSKYSISDEGRHNQSKAAAQKSTNDRNYWEGRPKGDEPAQSGPLSTAWGDATDPDVRPERRLHYRAQKGLNEDTPKKAAVWRSNVAKARGYSYSATVQGFEAAPGALWWPGVVIPVFDYEWEISDLLFVKGVKFSKSFEGGATTEISCTYKDGYSDKEGGAPKSRTSKSGLGAP
jgi:prophage tail gpP-like protein